MRNAVAITTNKHQALLGHNTSPHATIGHLRSMVQHGTTFDKHWARTAFRRWHRESLDRSSML